jgi:hypothetical protein
VSHFFLVSNIAISHPTVSLLDVLLQNNVVLFASGVPEHRTRISKSNTPLMLSHGRGKPFQKEMRDVPDVPNDSV